MSSVEVFAEQVSRYVESGYAALLGMDGAAFARWVDPLRGALPAAGSSGDGIPFVLIVPGVPASAAVPLIKQGAQDGYVDMHPTEPSSFRVAEDAAVPPCPYLLVDVETGRDSRGVAPRDAQRAVAARGRLPLTIEEGAALALLHPGILRSANAIQMMASRDGSKRIPSLWITAQGRPRLGWCFEGVPHSWMGVASAAARRTSPQP